MTKILAWDDTLLDYLRSSNEDEQVVNFISSKVLPHLAEIRCGINWLEIGPGPGTKTSSIAQSIEKISRQKIHRFQLLEPAENWQSFLRCNSPHLLRIGELTGTTFENYARRASEGSEDWKPNFITCLHVLYEPSLIREFFRYLSARKRDGRQLIACVVVEAENSAFFHLRQRLSTITQIGPALSVFEIRNLIYQFDLTATEFEVNGQSCNIPNTPAANDWLLPFLLGCNRFGLKSFPEQVIFKADRLIAEFLSSQSDGVLQVPDVAFVIKI